MSRGNSRPAESTLSSLTRDQTSHSSLQFHVSYWYLLVKYYISRYWGPPWCYSRSVRNNTVLWTKLSKVSQVSAFETSFVMYMWFSGAAFDCSVLTVHHQILQIFSFHAYHFFTHSIPRFFSFRRRVIPLFGMFFHYVSLALFHVILSR